MIAIEPIRNCYKGQNYPPYIIEGYKILQFQCIRLKTAYVQITFLGYLLLEAISIT